jgi:SOS-response transcriptional repressor LexA
MLLTERQLDVLRFIRDYRRENALAPTLEEIAAFFDVTKITIHEHLGHLERKGAIFGCEAKRAGSRSSMTRTARKGAVWCRMR